MAKPTYFIMLVLLSFLLLNEYSRKPDEQVLTSKTWILSSYGLRDDKKHKLTKGVHYHLNFYEYPHIATLSTSCPAQNASGKYRINDQGRLFILRCSSNYLTQRCPDNDDSKHYRQAKDFIKGVLFLTVTGSEYHIGGNELRLASSDGEQLIFTGVNNGERMIFFEQLLGVFWKMLFPCKTR
jgi:hypothetical protein